MSHRRRNSGAWLPVAAVLMWAACARNAWRDQQVERVTLDLAEAERNGALRCAPRELAIARSHLEFAELERQQGFASRADGHLRVADQNARASRLLSPPEHCAAARATLSDK
jgi:OOP family OmpA-OmpF porin